MTDTWEQVTEQRVPFDPEQPDKTFSIEWASRGLTWLYANRRQVFGDMVTQGILEIEKTRGRRS